ncbi:hypothetical protein [Methanobrevibacter sp.]
MNRKILFSVLISLTVICLINCVCAHEAEYPEPYIDNPKINEVVSGNVDFNISVEDHHETLYVNVTATHRDTNTVYFEAQDTNPTDGWSCTWDTSNAPNGKYYVSAVALNSANLKGQYNILLTLNNTKKESNIVLDNTMGVVNESNSIIAHLYDKESKAISNKNLEVIIDGETQNPATTNGEGMALISFTPKEAKDYEILVKFAGDNVYAPFELSQVISILANSTTITVNEITGNNKEKILLSANLKNYAGLISNKQIDFYINGTKVGSDLTDENGDAKLDYTIEQVGGRYIYSAQYTDESDKTFKAFSSLYVPESSVYVRIAAMTYSKDGIFTVGNNVKFTYTLYNDGPDTAQDVVFRYSIPKSLKYVGSSPSQGNVTFDSSANQIIWQLGDVEVGQKTLDIEFKALSANKNNLAPELSAKTYDKSIANNITRNTFIVKSYKLAANDLTKYFTGNDKFKIYVRDGDGGAVSGAIITIKFGKQNLKLKTNSKGYVELDTKGLGVGKYTIKATCNSLSVSKKITVKPLLITKNLSKKKAKTIKYTAKLVNTKGKIVKNKKITFKLNGKTYAAKTNSKGIATISLKNLKVGKHSITTSYGKSTVKNTITIKK